MIYKSLANIPLVDILDAHNDAFSDYEVPMQLTLERFNQINIQRGVSYPLSLGAFDGDRLVGFILNAVRIWAGKKTAYDCGTGVRVAYRKQKIGKTMFAELVPLLKQHGVEQYLLEVMKNNTPAFDLYKKQGFEIVRGFKCLSMEFTDEIKAKCAKVSIPENVEIKINGKLELSQVTSFWDALPSWQNSNDSVNTALDDFNIYTAMKNTEVVGYAVVGKKNGGISHFGIKKEFRRQHIATYLFSTIVTDLQVHGLFVLNVDEISMATVKFLDSMGFETFTEQFEMVFTLN